MNTRPVIRQMKIPMTSLFTDQFIRPITVDMSNSFITNQIEEATMGYSSISSSSLAEIAPAIIKPKAEVSSPAHIANGWREKRFRFFMEIELVRTQYSANYLLITGFTDYAGASMSGAIAPDMKLYFNNITQYTDNVFFNEANGFSGVRRATQNNSQVILPVNTPAMAQFSNRVRACDVISNLAIQDATENDPYVVNTVGSMISTAQSSRARQLPSVYVSNILNASMVAGKMVSSGHNPMADDLAYYQEMIGKVKESGWTNNAFLASIVQKTNYVNSGYVTWGELIALYPELNLDSVTEVQLVKNTIDYTANTDSTRGISFENQAVAIIQNILPAIMTMYMIHQASFMLTNETIDGQHKLIPSTIIPMTDKINVNTTVCTFIDQVLAQLAPAIAGGHGFTYRAQISANSLTEMVVTISMNGGHEVVRAVPLYADSPLSCFGYARREELDHITHEIGSLINAMSAATGHIDFEPSLADLNGGDFDPLAMSGVKQTDNGNSDPFQNNVNELFNAVPGEQFSTDPLRV